MPGKKKLLQSENTIEVVLIDVSESPVERPKKQRRYYSGKKKRHTQKTQEIADKKTKKIICIAFGKVRNHNFKLLNASKTHIHQSIESKANTGYQGLKKLHSNTVMPKKKSKKSQLTKEDKKNNREISSQRVSEENIIRELKNI